MKKKYENPNLEIILFADEDIIVTSGGVGGLFDGEPGDESQDPEDQFVKTIINTFRRNHAPFCVL